MICDNCQKQNLTSANFCNFCGASLLENQLRSNQQASKDVDTKPTDSGWQIETDQNLDSSGAMGKQNTVIENSINRKSDSGSNSKKKIAAIPLELATITYILITFSGAFLIYYVGFVNQIEPGLRTIFPVFIVVLWAIFTFLFWKWKKKREGEISINDSQSELVGEVRGFKTRNETSNGFLFIFTGIKVTEEIWNFRLERYFEGQQLPPISVEIRGRKFHGFINEGDTVQLLTDWKDGLHKTKKVFNLTNNILVKSKK